MKKLFILCAVVLTGCASNPLAFTNTEVITAKQYVVRTAPDQLKTLPPLPPKIANPATATNTQVATFINNTEQYVSDLEAMIQTLVSFYEKPVTTTEAGTMQPVTPRSPATPSPGRVIQPQTTAEVNKP
ncbi:hypothetical protein [Acinetobacter sp.]|uniref:hypothetical protein n=1 Tax=Acinetobacter sp. TaxID=472 RepID=UPI00388D5521